MAQYASDEEIDWAAPEGVPPNPISEDEEDDQADKERGVRQEAQEHMPSVDEDVIVAQASVVNRALFEDDVEGNEGILSHPYVFSSQGPSQTRVDEDPVLVVQKPTPVVQEPVAVAQEPTRVVFDPVWDIRDAVAAAQERSRVLRNRLRRH
ncbi:unnamed protein product [Calypogeia fissa]